MLLPQTLLGFQCMNYVTFTRLESCVTPEGEAVLLRTRCPLSAPVREEPSLALAGQGHLWVTVAVDVTEASFGLPTWYRVPSTGAIFPHFS